MHIIDADDFSEANNGLDLLFRFRANNPEFKITLFTVIGLCSKSFLDLVKTVSWIDLCPHGLFHPTPTECMNWSYKESKEYLKSIEPLGLTKGFKAPGWQISDGMYKALLEAGYWVADQPYNNSRRPKELRAYLLDKDNKHHYHIQNVCGNGLQERYREIMGLKGECKFIKECLT